MPGSEAALLLAEAVDSAMPSLQVLDLGYNEIGEAGGKALVDALGAAGRLHSLDLRGCPASSPSLPAAMGSSRRCR